MQIDYRKLTEPTVEIAQAFERWENDVTLIPFMRPNNNEEDLLKRHSVTVEDLTQRITQEQIYLIYQDGMLVGEMDFKVDPPHLYKNEPDTAWLGITIGEAVGRGKGIGGRAMQFLEEQIQRQGLRRIELGVFEFNTPAIRLYQRCGYTVIGRLEDFTYWQGKMWQDIRMEKRFPASEHDTPGIAGSQHGNL